MTDQCHNLCLLSYLSAPDTGLVQLEYSNLRRCRERFLGILLREGTQSVCWPCPVLE
jgi:hypothetical protein